MERQEAISYLRGDFPEFGNRPNVCVLEPKGSTDALWDVHEFARLVASLFASAQRKRVQRAFDQMENFLRTGSAEVRDWVSSFLEALQDIAAWKASGSDVFLRFLGPETRRAWSALEAIRQDLEDYPTLEAEVLMWRVVHPDLPRAGSTRAA